MMCDDERLLEAESGDGVAGSGLEMARFDGEKASSRSGMPRSKSSGLSLGCRAIPKPCWACFSSMAASHCPVSSCSWSSDPFALAGDDHRSGKATACRRRASGGTRSGYAPGYYMYLASYLLECVPLRLFYI
ncbi:hypothetical protein AKJ16_DCAP12804 [Drosera capensis]